MSASLSPVCGRAPGWLSILAAIAGRTAIASSTTGWPVNGINGTGTVVVVSGTVVGASVAATVVGAIDVVVDSDESPPPPHAANAIPARVIEKAKRRF